MKELTKGKQKTGQNKQIDSNSGTFQCEGKLI